MTCRRVSSSIHLAKGNDHLQLLVLFAHPKPDVRPARKKTGVGITLHQGRDIGQRGGRKIAAFGADRKHGMALHAAQLLDHGVIFVRLVLGACAAVAIHALRGVNNGTIAGAAAEVAGQDIIDELARRLRLGFVQRKQRHDKARGAEPTLRGVTRDHGALHRMQAPIRRPQAFDRDQSFTVQYGHKLHAGIDRTKVQTVVSQLPQNHRAGATVPFGAAFLRAGSPQLLAQII